MGPEVPLPCSQEAAIVAHLTQSTRTHNHPIFLYDLIDLLQFHLCLGLPNSIFPSGFPTRSLCTTFIIHFTRSTFYSRLIFFVEHLVRSSDYESPHHVIFFIPLTISLFRVQVLFLALCCHLSIEGKQKMLSIRKL